MLLELLTMAAHLLLSLLLNSMIDLLLHLLLDELLYLLHHLCVHLRIFQNETVLFTFQLLTTNLLNLTVVHYFS